MGKKGTIFFIFAIVAVVIGFKTLCSSPKVENKLLSAIYIEDGRVLAENEGKLVIVPGKIEADVPFTDKLTGATLPTFKAERIVDIYKKEADEDDDGKYVTKWKWVKTTRSGEINSQNPISCFLYAPAKVGEFDIDHRMMTAISVDRHHGEFDRNELAKMGFRTELRDGLVYVTNTDFMPHDIAGEAKTNTSSYAAREGQMRFSYKIYPQEKPTEFTFVGIQKNGRIEPDNTLGAQSAFAGIKARDELIQDNKNNSKTGAIIAWIIAALFCMLGIGSYKAQTKEAQGK